MAIERYVRNWSRTTDDLFLPVSSCTETLISILIDCALAFTSFIESSIAMTFWRSQPDSLLRQPYSSLYCSDSQLASGDRIWASTMLSNGKCMTSWSVMQTVISYMPMRPWRPNTLVYLNSCQESLKRVSATSRLSFDVLPPPSLTVDQTKIALWTIEHAVYWYWRLCNETTDKCNSFSRVREVLARVAQPQPSGLTKKLEVLLQQHQIIRENEYLIKPNSCCKLLY